MPVRDMLRVVPVETLSDSIDMADVALHNEPHAAPRIQRGTNVNQPITLAHRAQKNGASQRSVMYGEPQ